MPASPKAPPSQPNSDSLRNIELTLIDESPLQPRNGSMHVTEMAASIQQHGLLDPVLVRQTDGGRYELIGGHRRVAALKQLGTVSAVAAFVREADDQSAADLLLEDNMERDDLSPLELGRFFAMYMKRFGINQTDMGKRFGYAQETVSQYVSLTELPEGVRTLVEEGRLPISHVKQIKSIGDETEMVRVAQSVAAPDRDAPPSTLNDVKWKSEEAKRRLKVKADRDTDKIKAERELEGIREKVLKAVMPAPEGKGFLDADTGLPVLFGTVRLKDYGSDLVVGKPSMKAKPFDPLADERCVKMAKQLELSFKGGGVNGVSGEWLVGAVPVLTRAVWKRLGKSGQVSASKCPCKGDHVAVVGWNVTRELSVSQAAPNYTRTKHDTSKPVDKALFCTDGGAVQCALLEGKIRQLEKEMESEKVESEAVTAFIAAAPVPDLKALVFLAACTAGWNNDVEAAVKEAIADPAKAWREMLEAFAEEYSRHGGALPMQKVFDLLPPEPEPAIRIVTSDGETHEGQSLHDEPKGGE